MFLKHKSIKYLFAIGHNSRIYVISCNDRNKIEYTNEQREKITKLINEKVHKYIFDNYKSGKLFILKGLEETSE